MTKRKLDHGPCERDDKSYDQARDEMRRLDDLDLAPPARMSHAAVLRLLDRMVRESPSCGERASSWTGLWT